MEFDHIVVGAGSAGAVLAARLSEDPQRRVLLIEAGGTHRNMLISMPAGWGKLMDDPRFSWCYRTEPEAWAGGRRIKLPRGRVLGGSASINGLLYVRGDRRDYDRWVEMGAEGWSWDELMPYFVRSEDQGRFEGPQHGRGGSLAATDLPRPHPLTEAMLGAAAQNGLAFRDDYNLGEVEGASRVQINVRDGRRAAVASTLLEPAMRRPNLVVFTQARATRLLMEGRRVVGVRVARAGKTEDIRARGEVALCGGAINSPQLLMLSGIGPAQALQALGIAVVHDLAGVGANLQDHAIVPMTWRCRAGISSLNQSFQGLGLIGSTLRYLFTRSGPLASPAAEFMCWYKSDPSQAYADIQAFGLPVTGDVERAVGEGDVTQPDAYPGFTLAPYQVRPHSRGQVGLHSADPTANARIAPNYLDDERDRRALLSALRWLDRMAKQPALAACIDARTRPAPDAADTDEAWLEYVSRTLTTGHHPVGTCRMGSAQDPGSVVDPQLRVRGIGGLRVVDASVMPALISGNTNATAVAIGERAAQWMRAV